MTSSIKGHLKRVDTPGSKLGLSQQLALSAASLCLVIGIALVTLAGISSRHMQLEQQEEYGTALAQLIAKRVTTALETGDLLSIAASLQRFVVRSAVEQVELFDVEGNELGQAGRASGNNLHHYESSVHIDNDVAGLVKVTLKSDAAQAAHTRLIISLLGLTVLLSMAAYGAARHWGQQIANKLLALAKTVSTHEEEAAPDTTVNEIDVLTKHINALPMDLLRTRGSIVQRDENYQTTAVLYLHLSSLSGYVDTLDQHSLHRYTDRLHQILYAAAGFYAGQIQVSRQFGIAIFFNGDSNAGSAAFRAASCGWLIGVVCRELEKHISLSMTIAMAISQSELGTGDEADIYPGLYMQHTLDELQSLCAQKPPKILLAPIVCEDNDVAGRLEFEATEMKNYSMLSNFEGPYKDLLERQFRLIWKRLSATS
jgi:hypothetical protein